MSFRNIRTMHSNPRLREDAEREWVMSSIDVTQDIFCGRDGRDKSLNRAVSAAKATSTVRSFSPTSPDTSFPPP